MGKSDSKFVDKTICDCYNVVCRLINGISFLESGCWQWNGYKVKGYGEIRIKGIPTKRPHRISYAVFRESVPAKMDIDHLCRNRACINPFHLEVVTPKENVLRGLGSTALYAKRNKCSHGHEYTPENTFTRFSVTGAPFRGCRICSARRMREVRARKRLKKCLDLQRMTSKIS